MASRLCKRCKIERTSARVCTACAAARTCERCSVKHGRGAQAKYCLDCLPKVAIEKYHPKEGRRVVREAHDWDRPDYMGLNPDSHDWARLAAYIDGEGSINLTPKKTTNGSTSYSSRVVVTNTDFRLAKWCSDIFGIRAHHKAAWDPSGSRAINWKPCYFSQADSFRAAWVLRNCLPWFVLKREQAEVVLENQKSMRVDTWQRGSGVMLPENVLEFRADPKSRLTALNKRGSTESNTLAKEG